MINKTGFDINLKWEFVPPDGLGYMQAAVVAADADNDGECEVFVGSYTKSIYCLKSSDGSVKWSYELPHDIVGCNNLSLSDVDGDGQLEVVFATEIYPAPTVSAPTVYALKTGSGLKNRLLWKRPLEGQFIAGGLGCFTDTDRKKKILALTRRFEHPEKVNHGRLYLLDALTGEIIWGPIGEEDVCSCGPAVADVNGDGTLEFIYGNHYWRDIPLRGCTVYRSVKDGSVVWNYQTKDDPGANTMTICDINGDNDTEVIVTYQHYKDVVKPSWGTTVLSAKTGKPIWERNFWASSGVAQEMYAEKKWSSPEALCIIIRRLSAPGGRTVKQYGKTLLEAVPKEPPSQSI